jgi:ribokinase
MIVVFGSINIDIVVPVAALPRPGETVLGPGYRLVPGGKGANQALAAARAGASVRMVGRVGRDPFAALALAELVAAGIDLAAVERDDERPTGCALIPVDRDGQNLIVVAAGAAAAPRGAGRDVLLGPETLLLLQMEVPADELGADRPRPRRRPRAAERRPGGRIRAPLARSVAWSMEAGRRKPAASACRPHRPPRPPRPSPPPPA